MIRYEELLFENLVSTQTLLAKREVLQQECFNERYPALEDWELALRIAKAFKLAYLKEPLVDVFVQRDSLSNGLDRILCGAPDSHPVSIRRAIIRDDRVSQQWMHSFRWCGHACGKRVVGACLRLMSLRRPPRQNYFYLREAHAEWEGIETICKKLRGRGFFCRKVPSLALPPEKTGEGTLGRGRFSERSASPPRPLSPEERLAFGVWALLLGVGSA